uniref:probable E3 ubiquitin-protein ligase HECTD2 isoform X2 n=1 Tax=Ciona intestinalis TaxID=7719 RepID=UPI00089DC59E|nr:probable E3 ubiquitin-protein ligase HECTD2 isoform X2 [Ciona intestinalis]|eukprot:XP_018668053.1 probable E3 ubiquitin-protein ligase HECTD2 isoform X2 [Ciona intestinalis]
MYSSGLPLTPSKPRPPSRGTPTRGTPPHEPRQTNRPQKLPPIRKKSSGKSQVDHRDNKHNESSKSGNANPEGAVPTIETTDDETSSSKLGEDLFLSEDPPRPRNPFNDLVHPITPPSMCGDASLGGAEGLKRPRINPNNLHGIQASKSQEFTPQDPSSPSTRITCRSAGDMRKTLRESEDRKPFVVFGIKQFRHELDKWKKTKKVYKLQEFYRAVFDSFESINETFKKNSVPSCRSRNGRSSRWVKRDRIPDPCLQHKFVGLVYEVLTLMPREVQKLVLKGIVNCLLNEWKSAKQESDLRAYFILLQNPLFTQTNTYGVFAHLLRQVATFNEHDQTLVTHWLRRLSTPRFRPIIERIHQFIQLRLFPGQSELPPMSNCGWWIPSAVKVLSMLNKANEMIKPRLVSFREFYNHSIDHIDVTAEYRQWENPASHSGFTFCQFPFILSLLAKLKILRRDQEREMIRTARDELVEFVRRRPTRVPCVSQLYLNISVRRQNLLQDSLDQIYGNRKQLKKKLRVSFIGEPGYDMGGLTKEWFLLLLRKVLAPDYNTFVYNNKSHCYWFADNGCENSSDLFLVGVLMGLAVYNCITLDIRLPLVCYKKLLSSVPKSGVQQPDSISGPNISETGSPVSGQTIQQTGSAVSQTGQTISQTDSTSQQSGPASQQSGPNSQQSGPTSQQAENEKETINQNLCGVIPVTLEDYRSIDPDMVRGLEELLNYDGDVEDDFGLTFQTTRSELGNIRSIPLKRGGEEISVTEFNRDEYVQAYLEYKMNRSVYRQFLAFYHGFYTVCSSNALTFLCPEELEVLICGNAVFDLKDLKKHTAYQGYRSNDPTIIYFWEVLLSLPRELQKKFLHFCTGSDRVPVGGMQELNFKIVRTPTAQNMLPMAHTCFNQLLLPPYGNKQHLEGKLIIAVSNAEGFGLE